VALGYTPVTWANGSGGGTALSAANLNQMEDGVEAAHANAVDKTLLDAKGDILAASAADTPARLAVGTNGQVLTAASGETTGLQWATPSLAATIADAKGDLIAATAADTLARLAVGTDGQVLTAASGEATGLEWATPSASAMVEISSTTLGEAAASIDLASIPATYESLRLIVVARHDVAVVSAAMSLRFNGDTGNNYADQYLLAGHTTVTGAAAVNQTLALAGRSAGSSADANNAVVTVIDIPLYAGTTWNKAFLSHSAVQDEDTSANVSHYFISGIWRSTAAINQITLTPASGNFIAGTYCALYGVGG